VIKVRRFFKDLKRWFVLDTVVFVAEPELKRQDVLNEIALRDKWASKYDFALGVYKNKMEKEAVMKRMGSFSGDLILDAGAGTGRISALLAQRGAKVVALDLSLSSLKICKKRAALQVILADLGALPFKPLVFDKVVCCEVLEHVSREKREVDLHEVRRVMKYKALAIITVYNYALSYAVRADRQGFNPEGSYYHRFLSPQFKMLLMKFFTRENITIHSVVNLKDFPFKFYLVERILEEIFLSFLIGGLFLAECRK